MKHLKVYEKFEVGPDWSAIDEFCSENGIRNYKVNKNGSIDVDGNVNLYASKSILRNKKIPFKFNRINGRFDCDRNVLTTLENCPNYVSIHFGVANNKLTTLLGGPTFVGENYNCTGNNLKDLYGFPEAFLGSLRIHFVGFDPEETRNPVCEILNLCTLFLKSDANNDLSMIMTTKEFNKLEIRFIKLLNEYKAIRNQDTIIQDRLEEALYGIGINNFPKDYSFKNYKLI